MPPRRDPGGQQDLPGGTVPAHAGIIPSILATLPATLTVGVHGTFCLWHRPNFSGTSCCCANTVALCPHHITLAIRRPSPPMVRPHTENAQKASSCNLLPNTHTDMSLRLARSFGVAEIASTSQ